MEGGRGVTGAGGEDEEAGAWREPPDLLMSMDNLAFTFAKQGRWKGAEELQGPGNGDEEAGAGEDHPDCS